MIHLCTSPSDSEIAISKKDRQHETTKLVYDLFTFYLYCDRYDLYSGSICAGQHEDRTAALQYVFNPSEGSFSEGSFWTDGVEEEMQSTDDAAADDLNSTDADSSDGTASDNTDTVTSDQKLTEQPQRELPQIPDDFTGVLFVGDSRTVGLSEYGKLGNADVFADTGMSVYNVTKKALPAPDGEKHTLDERLQEKNYQIILLMLGINELGYDRNVSYKRYAELVEHIRELQPDAWIVLEANLHVTQAQSEKDDIFNNENINQVNENICQLAQENGLGYLDVNVLFDDENVALRLIILQMGHISLALI